MGVQRHCLQIYLQWISSRSWVEIPVLLERVRYSSQVRTQCFQISCCLDAPVVSINNSRKTFWSPTHHPCYQHTHQYDCPYNTVIFMDIYQQLNNSITHNHKRPQRIELTCHHNDITYLTQMSPYWIAVSRWGQNVFWYWRIYQTAYAVWDEARLQLGLKTD